MSVPARVPIAGRVQQYSGGTQCGGRAFVYVRVCGYLLADAAAALYLCVVKEITPVLRVGSRIEI